MRRQVSSISATLDLRQVSSISDKLEMR
jgi:hypothetical protein